ncbi:ATP-binding protein [Bacillus circulans]|uniref:ATP-binding protein n=1 Tax=Niallia circulans TaxID=1397 RepID=A0AA91TR03_NIACI|nr:ATP-binding protein [Niallia circulans]AYV72482.1 ATP-binding protein [Niallia circulans]NRG27341.1 ATP-binding protein [Niallia circulans]PAD82527.1 ATP-binding protein [Niallia circulans]QJX60597.1 ATP-binding protein [Niallia circulans]
MRDVQVVSWNQKEELVISADNSGGIGQKEDDQVSVPYDIVSYFSFRVAVMECMAAGGVPFSVILQNFCGDDAWDILLAGIYKGIEELELEREIGITGSTESNFSFRQSAIGLTVLGKRPADLKDTTIINGKMAIIGSPLVGEEVILQQEKVVPLAVFSRLTKVDKCRIQPVGSKGILYELGQLKGDLVQEEEVQCSVDLLKSAGPATCFIVEYEKEVEAEIKRLTSGFFLEVQVSSR